MLSTVILTHNSQDTLEQTLQSVQWSDECIVIDDDSTDDTLNIVRKYSCLLFTRHLGDDFAAQRNFGLSKANGDWVLFVDSDEVVSEALRDDIRDSISRSGTGQKGIAGFFLRREDIFLGMTLKHGETANVTLVRLGKKHAGMWKRPVHEIWDIPHVTEVLPHPLYHTAHKNVAQFIDKINRYTSINARHLYHQGIRASMISIIGYPTAKFIRNYFLRLGFLDGTAGCVMAVLMSFHSFLTRAKLFILSHEHAR